jgi:hypothetical protein
MGMRIMGMQCVTMVGGPRIGYGLVRSEDIDLDGGQSASANLAHLKAGIDIERGSCLLKTVEGNARINKRAEQHVAADAGKAL